MYKDAILFWAKLFYIYVFLSVIFWEESSFKAVDVGDIFSYIKRSCKYTNILFFIIIPPVII